MKANIASAYNLTGPAAFLQCQGISAGLCRDPVFDFLRSKAGYIQPVDRRVWEIDPLIFLAQAHIDGSGCNYYCQRCRTGYDRNLLPVIFPFRLLSLLSQRSTLLVLLLLRLHQLLAFLLCQSLLLFPFIPLSAAAAVARLLISCFHKSNSVPSI